MKLSIELSDSQAKRLQAEAERLGVATEQLAQAAVSDLIARRDNDFRAAAEHVVQKNLGLYRRLA